MLSFFKALRTRLLGTGGAAAPEEEGEAVEYKGYSIRPTPYPAKGQYQTAGIVTKDTDEGVREHRFVRAETHASKDEAASFAIMKGKQIVDEQGDRMFGQRPPGPAQGTTTEPR
jgi:hypothetical protein